MSVLHDIALNVRKPKATFLANWLALRDKCSVDLFLVVRAYVTDVELHDFDLCTDELTQRTFLLLVALSEEGTTPPAVLPFRMGDVVELKDKSTTKGRVFGKGTHIIHQVRFGDTTFKYSTDRMAWIPHEALSLVEEANAASLAQLKKTIDDGDDDEGEW